jgi:hypothetical protein
MSEVEWWVIGWNKVTKAVAFMEGEGGLDPRSHITRCQS